MVAELAIENCFKPILGKTCFLKQEGVTAPWM